MDGERDAGARLDALERKVQELEAERERVRDRLGRALRDRKAWKLRALG